jgi:hypothetical protein
MGKVNPRAPGLGDEALPTEELMSPDFNLDRDYAGFSIDEARKAQYHGLDIQQFRHLDSKPNRKRIEQFTPQWIGEILLDPPYPNHPAVFPYRKSPSANVYPVVLSSTEAIFLGRDPAQFGPDAAAAATQRVADMKHPDFETVPEPAERWRVLQTYIDESIQPKRRASALLHGASRYRNSNGEAAQRIDRFNFVDFVRQRVIHPLLDDFCAANYWEEDSAKLLHEVTDFRLFFEGRVSDRRREWLRWHELLSVVLERKHGLFKQHVERATKRPNEQMVIKSADQPPVAASVVQ